jgi:hypothetical protein
MFPLLLIGKLDVNDFVSHYILFLIGWKDAQIVRQIRGTMTNPAPTSLCKTPAASQSTFIIWLLYSACDWYD